jgi:hypothetical protein
MFGIEKDFQKLMEQVYGPLNKDKQPPDTIEIGGVKYKRIEEPPTLSNKLEGWIETLNFTQSKEHKDLLVIEILNIVKEFMPDTYEGVGLSEYFLGYNDAIRKMEEKLK